MGTLRTSKADKEYKDAIKNGLLDGECALCTKPSIKEFRLWRIVLNSFPYDLIAESHHMFVPKRCITKEELSEEEISEMKEIKQKFLHVEYDWLLEAQNSKKTIPAHFHLHAIVGRDQKH